MTKKKEVFDYTAPGLLVGRDVIVGLNGGTNLKGEVRHADSDVIVIVAEPKSTLDIETQVVHTIVNVERIDFVQFKTDRE